MLEHKESHKQEEPELNDDCDERYSKNIDCQITSAMVMANKETDRWLRVYPAPSLPEQSVYSTIMRCILCQLGLFSFLVLWTMIAVFVIESFEGPQEVEVSMEFEKAQNQLVIDLATELRQITPLSPKWRYAIEKRIEDERQLTIEAMAEGARLKPGQFWNLPGTFLFTIYVMTALGFGAPVPHTLWGRTSALIYALLAVPTHIYLMVNASTYFVVRLDEYTMYLRENCCRKIYSNTENTQDNSRDSDARECTKKYSLRKTFMRCISVLGIGRCVPLVTLTYYVIGVTLFGIIRNKPPFETIVFPIEFTTTGGLDRVEGFVRVLYGLYVECGMCLLAWALATLRRRNSSSFERFASNHRLFDYDVRKERETRNKIVV
ncbi:uncharacterized protein LOC116774541 [Danaus plexippus]|uniref:uncharacterized protein LOC116774541 n=1 Tax=Danaus plexippus TaxID=13037 RepID=UPI002AAF2704|nr:uncharacterized protein LOC116774541 [Danaus plexippus]